MLAPDAIRRWATGKFPAFIDAHFQGRSLFPLDVSRFGRVDRSSSALEIDGQVRQLLDGSAEVVCPDLPAIARARRGLGYSVALTLTRLRVQREQPLPTRVWFETPADFLAFTGRSESWHRFLADLADLSAAGPAISAWVTKHARTIYARLVPGEGRALGLALAALQTRPFPDCFAREIALPGISGKFIEERLGFIADILRETASLAWRPGPDAHAQLGLRRTSRLLRLMVLDGRQADYGLPENRFGELPSGIQRILIVENLRTFLTLPSLPGTLALFGEGRAAQTLGGLSWLARVPLYYWGDLDPTGLDILNSLRRAYPQTVSIMMDSSTLTAHSHLVSAAPRLSHPTFDLLSSDELAAANEVQLRGIGIEQEKLPQADVHASLRSISSNSE